MPDRYDYDDGFQPYKKRKEEPELPIDDMFPGEYIEGIDVPLDDDFDDNDEYYIMEHKEEQAPRRPNRNESAFADYDRRIQSGEYYVKEAPRHNVATFLFFPIAILFLEMVLKISLGFNIFETIIFTVLFSVSIGLILTILCTIFKKSKSNRRFARILLFLITLGFMWQYLSYKMYGVFFGFEQYYQEKVAATENSFSMLKECVASNYITLILLVIPFLVLCIFSKYVFTFTKSGFGQKLLCLVIAAALVAGSVFFINAHDKKADKNKSAELFYEENNLNESTEYFGLLFSSGLNIYRKAAGFPDDNSDFEVKIEENTSASRNIDNN